ncbi:hypothetical protein [Streptomyces sp. NBC_01013]|uniref:hypothetical protein n=1 Tax=Streptomyces sp. NBC_01013 TaxID=2903718 RepID=UPI0038661389|nr:hypothetical protein OG538_23370 [Streptomyces sp. NBC_01013]
MGLFSRRKDSSNGTHRMLLLKDGRVQNVPTSLSGMELVQEVSRLLGSEHIRSTRIGDDLTLWHVEIAPGRPHPGAPNPAASRLAAEHGSPPVTGAAVVTGEVLYGSPYPLEPDKAAQVAAQLGG